MRLLATFMEERVHDGASNALRLNDSALNLGEEKEKRERERKKEEFSREESSICSIRFDSNSPGFPKIPNGRGISKRIFSWREQK